MGTKPTSGKHILFFKKARVPLHSVVWWWDKIYSNTMRCVLYVPYNTFFFVFFFPFSISDLPGAKRE
jgi:hypothetical protein